MQIIYFTIMKKWKKTVIEAVLILALATVIALVHNAVNINGINPFRHIEKIPVAGSGESNDAQGIVFIGLKKAKEFFYSGKKIIDARTVEAYREGHIPGAMLLSYYDMGKYLEKVLPFLSMDEDVLVYCSGVTCDDSELLARELYAMGFTRLFVYKGGFEEWEAEGLPVEKGLPGDGEEDTGDVQ